MKIKISLTAILLFLCSAQIVFAQEQPEAQKRKPMTISCGGCNAKVISLPQPEYPEAAKMARASGKVQVQVTIDEVGNTTEVKALSGNPLLHAAAIKAAEQARFKPLLLSGKPVRTTGLLVYNFVLDEPALPKQAEEKSQENFKSKPISFGFLNDKTIYLPQPKYPKEVLQPRTQGGVYVQVKINLQTGNVVSAMAISGNPLFKKYAAQAARLARFQPLKIEGLPLFATGIITYKHPFDSNSVRKTKTSKFLPLTVVGVVNKKAVYLPEPIYPKGCRCLGVIKVQIVIDTNGNVVSASAATGNPLLRVSAVQAARKTKFPPSRIDGEQLLVIAFLEYRFFSDGKVLT